MAYVQRGDLVMQTFGGINTQHHHVIPECGLVGTFELHISQFSQNCLNRIFPLTGLGLPDFLSV